MAHTFARPLFASLALATTLGLASQSTLAATINFDSFADNTNINGLDLGGVTVTNPSGVVSIYANNRFGVSNRSPGNAIGSFSGLSSNNPMIFTFSAPVTFVELFAGDGGGDTDSWSLAVFDAAVGGNQLGTVAAAASAAIRMSACRLPPARSCAPRRPGPTASPASASTT